MSLRRWIPRAAVCAALMAACVGLCAAEPEKKDPDVKPEVKADQKAEPPTPAAVTGPQQVTGLQARHLEGQTLLTWKEVDTPLKDAEINTVALRKLLGTLDKEKKVRYRIYRADKLMTSVEGLTPIAEARPLSCWNSEYFGVYPNEKQMAPRFIVEEGKEPVPPGTGIYAHNPKEPGEAFYAVTYSAGGTENKSISAENATQAALKETVGQGPFILQKIEKPKSFNYVDNATLHYYVRWESPPNCSIASKPYDYLVGVPANLAKPAPVGIHLHCWGANFCGGYGWWSDAEKGALLIATNQVPYDWWTGYHEFLWTDKPLKTKDDWNKGVVRAFSQKRLFSFHDWVGTKWETDPKRTFVAGISMGGSGAPMLAIRYPERIAYARSWVGVHIPMKTRQFKGSYEGMYGNPDFGVKFEDGTPVWDYYSDVWYLKNHPEKEIGFISFSNGKNDGAIGWPQAVEFFQALQETKRPHLFQWGQGGHNERVVMPLSLSAKTMGIDVRVDQSLPAFTHCSIDNNPGNGDPADGEPAGSCNLYLFWETQDIVDEENSWETTTGLVFKATKDECTVDVTPRRLQKLKAKPGEKFKWSNTSLQDKKEIQTGEVTADAIGLLTLEKVTVSKGKNRLKISR